MNISEFENKKIINASTLGDEFFRHKLFMIAKILYVMQGMVNKERNQENLPIHSTVERGDDIKVVGEFICDELSFLDISDIEYDICIKNNPVSIQIGSHYVSYNLTQLSKSWFKVNFDFKVPLSFLKENDYRLVPRDDF